jgi:hypothetical protein
VGDGTVEALAEACSELELLDLTGCLDVTNDAMEAVALGLTRLRVLRLSKCAGLTDEGLEALARAEALLQSTPLGAEGLRGSLTHSTQQPGGPSVVEEPREALPDGELTGCGLEGLGQV